MWDEATRDKCRIGGDDVQRGCPLGTTRTVESWVISCLHIKWAVVRGVLAEMKS